MLSRDRRWGLVQRAGSVLIAMMLAMGPAIARSPEPSPASGGSEIRGNVVARDGLTAVIGVVVKVANLATKQVFTSAATGADGSYVLSDLPAGWYDLAVETRSGMFVSDSLVRTTAGKGTNVSVALAPEEGEEGEEGQKAEEEGQPEGENPPGEQEPAEPEQQPKKKQGPGFWKSPGGAAILIVGGSIALAAAAKNATDNGSTVSVPPPMTGGGS